MISKKYEVQWVKTYHAFGIVSVIADSKDDAHDKVADQIGDYEGSMQYDADLDEITVLSESIKETD